MNSIISCILMHASPDEVRFVMIDPKRVELSAFAPIPHLAFSNIVVDMDKVVGTLQAVIHEMESRYRKFAALAVRNIDGYNRSPRATDKLPYWVVIIDELADLMMAAPFEVERQICRLAQLARATGIHLVVATQRPSVDVITGLIKANFPTRIAFAVSSQVDSRTILDMARRREAAGPRRHALHGARRREAEAPAGRLRLRRGDRAARRASGRRSASPTSSARRSTTCSTRRRPSWSRRARPTTCSSGRRSWRTSTTASRRRCCSGGCASATRARRGSMDMLEEQGVVGPAEGGGSREVYPPEDRNPYGNDPEELKF